VKSVGTVRLLLSTEVKMAALYKRKSRTGKGYTWYVRYNQFGEQKWKTTGTADKKLAEEMRRKIEVETTRLEAGLPIPNSINRISFEKFIGLYIADRIDRMAPRTIKTDRDALSIFIVFMKDKKNLVSSITSRDVEKFREWRLKSVAPGTVNIALTALRAAFQWAEEHNYTEKNPFAIRNLKIRLDMKIPRALTPDEIERFFEAVDNQHKPIFSFILSTGARRSEVYKLLRDDVDFQSKTITFRNTKGKKDRAVPITLELAHLLKSINRVQDRVFPYNVSWFTHLFRKYRQKAGLGDHLTLHSLRHTSATGLLRGGANIYTVQKLLGHSSISVTERYLHALPDDLLEAAEILSKKAKITAAM